MSNELALNEVMSVGAALAESNYFSDAKAASQAVVKVLAGQELGIGPVAAMTGLYIVKGKVTLSANIMAGLIKSSQKYNYKIEDHSAKGCAIEFFENGESVGVSEFTIDDAKTAGLLNSDPWKKYPKNMVFNRALSNGAKWFCPDLFNGQSVYTPEELEQPENEDNNDFVVEVVQPSKMSNADLIKDILSKSPPERKAMVEEYKNKLDYTGDLTIPAVNEWLQSQ